MKLRHVALNGNITSNQQRARRFHPFAASIQAVWTLHWTGHVGARFETGQYVHESDCVAGVELVGTQKREMGGVLLNYFYAVGEAAVGLVAWMTKSWVAIQLAVSAPPAMFILYYW